MYLLFNFCSFVFHGECVALTAALCLVCTNLRLPYYYAIFKYIHIYILLIFFVLKYVRKYLCCVSLNLKHCLVLGCFYNGRIDRQCGCRYVKPVLCFLFI